MDCTNVVPSAGFVREAGAAIAFNRWHVSCCNEDMPDCTQPRYTDASPWLASLRLRFALDAGTTRLMERAHRGHLPRHMLHPPGGVVGGDQRATDVDVGAGAHNFLTMPGAARWHRANGRVSSQRVTLAVDAGGGRALHPQRDPVLRGARIE